MHMREYAMLASIAHEPRSGYDLTKWFELVARHFCTAGYGSVYPALASFERDGLVAHQTMPSDRGPERKVYSITEAGLEVLLGWSETPAADAQVRDEQLVKALAYGFLATETVLGLLRDARERHASRLSYFRELEGGLKRRLEAGSISEAAYMGTMLTLMRGIGAEASYVAWCDEAVALVSARASQRRGGTERGSS